VTSAVIRPATRGDLPGIGPLAALLVRAHYDFDPQRFIAASEATAREYAAFLGTQLGKSDIIILVAELDGEVVGYTFSGVEGYDYMTLRGPAGMLHDLVVDPRCRGRGVGKQLLDATLAALKAHGAPRVMLWTAPRNESAQRLFTRAGFRCTMLEMTREL
jgi:ribosomal protein S18 acetylase RimI-like enzyme